MARDPVVDLGTRPDAVFPLVPLWSRRFLLLPDASLVGTRRIISRISIATPAEVKVLNRLTKPYGGPHSAAVGRLYIFRVRPSDSGGGIVRSIAVFHYLRDDSSRMAQTVLDRNRAGGVALCRALSRCEGGTEAACITDTTPKPSRRGDRYRAFAAHAARSATSPAQPQERVKPAPPWP